MGRCRIRIGFSIKNVVQALYAMVGVVAIYRAGSWVGAVCAGTDEGCWLAIGCPNHRGVAATRRKWGSDSVGHTPIPEPPLLYMSRDAIQREN